MKVWTIWVCSGDVTWLAGAWDNESVAINPEGWHEALAKEREAYGDDCVSIVSTTVDFEAVLATFAAPVIVSSPVEKELVP